VAAAKGLALATRKQFIGIHHIEGHIYSAILSDEAVRFPHICLAAAGGHNLLVLVNEIGDYEIVGRTLDDAAGEAFDKVAKELGLGFPGGPLVDKLAMEGDPTRFIFPRPLLGRPGYDFSFSGLKTAVRELIRKLGNSVRDHKADIAASFQAAVVDVLISQALKAAADYRVEQVTVVGGVAANSELRRRFNTGSQSNGIRISFSKRDLCTDNAAMVAGLGYHYLRRGVFSDLNLNAFPNAPLGKRLETYR
jgi:N6-L-threonylcarbamoyladenine synthase